MGKSKRATITVEYYAVVSLETNAEMDVATKVMIPLTNKESGMVGVLPVFATREQAVAFCKEAEIIPVHFQIAEPPLPKGLWATVKEMIRRGRDE